MKTVTPIAPKGRTMAKPPPAELTFLALLQSFRGGVVLADADQALSELIAAINDTGSKGTLTLTMPLKMNKGGQIEILPTIALKKPRRALPAGIFYATDDNRLSRRDPSQGDWIDQFGEVHPAAK